HLGRFHQPTDDEIEKLERLFRSHPVEDVPPGRFPRLVFFDGAPQPFAVDVLAALLAGAAPDSQRFFTRASGAQTPKNEVGHAVAVVRVVPVASSQLGATLDVAD